MNFAKSRELRGALTALCLLLTLFLLFFPLLRARGAENDLIAWKLTQVDDVWGPRIVYVNENGLKAVYNKAHYVMEYAAPDWQIVYYNQDRKNIFKTTFDQWKNSPSLQAKVMKDAYFPEKPVTIKGPITLVAGRKSFCSLIHSKKAVGLESVAGIEWYTLPDISISSPIVKLNAATYGKTIGKDYPVQIITLLGSGARKMRLLTTKIERVRVAANFFDAPSDYAAAKNADEVRQ